MPYDSIPVEAVPRAGPVVAFFNLGEAFRRIGSEADARRFLTLSADAAPENETDRIILPLTLSTLIGALGASEADRVEIQRRFQQFLALQRAPGFDAVFARSMFAQDDVAMAPTANWSRVEVLVTALDRGLTESQVASDFWRAEVLCGRARLSQFRGDERNRIARLWSEALMRASASENWRILLQAGHALGFEFSEFAPSFRQLAYYQFECLRAAEAVGQSLEVLGNNLLTAWSQLDYRRLSETDLETKQTLKDSAVAMKNAGLSPTVAGPVIVLLLARLHHHEGPSREWARQQIEGHHVEIPDSVRGQLEEI